MQTVVVKIGSSSITDEQGTIAVEAIGKLCDDIAAARALGHRVVLVTSGAIAAGLPAIGMTRADAPDTATLQAVSAIGQSRLMRVYDDILEARGLVGGQIPSPAGDQILLSLTRMQAIRAVDARDNSLTAEAGCTLVAVQEAAAAAERLFPLSLASEGTARIGGLVSTNAGGTGVLRYGSMRDLVLGLEVVLADGRVWNGLRALRKDNTGYDIKQWFVGAEGTLGIVTAAMLKLFPRPRAV